MVGRSSKSRSTPKAAPASARKPVEIINCFDEDDDVIIEENGDKEGEQLVMECEEEELTPEQQRAYEISEKEFASYESQMRSQPYPSVPAAAATSSNGRASGSRSSRTSAPPVAASPSPSRGRPVRQVQPPVQYRPPPPAPRRSNPPPAPVVLPSPADGRRSTRSRTTSATPPKAPPGDEMVTYLVDSRTGGFITNIPESKVGAIQVPPGTVLHRAPKSTLPDSVPINVKAAASRGRGRGGMRAQPVMPPTRSSLPAAKQPVASTSGFGRGGGRASIQPAPASTSRATRAAAPEPQRAPATIRTVHLKPNPSAAKPTKGPLAPFPTLFTFAKPNNAHPAELAQRQRNELDAKVKGYLVFTPSKFTEWLIQAGLLRSKQHCTLHKGKDGHHVPLKLAMYNDSTKFPSTGGYVWISDCCPERFVSVFRGSIFEGQNHPPVTVLKLIYHWACQTNPTNVVNWVKTDPQYINGFYRLMKSLCALSVYSIMPKFGGNNKAVEVAIADLVTNAGPGKSTSFEVFGIYDKSTKLVRLLGADRGRTSASARYTTYRQYLASTVHSRSVLILDSSVDKASISAALPNARIVFDPAKTENIVNYLTKHVPKIFASTLGSLNSGQVQPFLDELAWREKWGRSAAEAYDSIVSQLAAETKNSEKLSDGLITRLSRIASAPAAKTLHQMIPAAYDEHPAVSPAPARGSRASQAAAPAHPPPARRSQQQQQPPPHRPAPTPSPARNRTPAAARAPPPQAQKRAAPPAESSPSPDHSPPPAKRHCPEMVELHKHYYGQLTATKAPPASTTTSFKCPVCAKIFNFNTAFTRHLFMHLETTRSFSIDLGDLTLCKYCFRNFGTPYAMQTHVDEVHLRRNNLLVCGICNEPFKTRMDLFAHMHMNHVQAELPYGCELCGFRSSFHRCLLDHFESAHSETDRLLCHYCLKTYTNRGVFFGHIQKHQGGKRSEAPGSKNKCKKCCLSFQKAEHLRDHLQKDHISFSGFKGFESAPLEPGTEAIMMPKPDDKKRRKGPPVFPPVMYPAASLGSISLPSSSKAAKAVCKECRKPFGTNHFKSAWICSHCPYSTCCDAMINAHVNTFHGHKPSYDMSKPVMLRKTMFCVCGFGAYSGNKLAAHLALCGKKSAYPSRHRASLATVSAQSATFPELINLDDEDEDDHESANFDSGDFASESFDMDMDSSGVRGSNGVGDGGEKDDTKKKKRRRRHGAEDINTVWLKAIWASRNMPIPGNDGDASHEEDFDYVDEETPSVLQAVGLHKPGAYQKVRKVSESQQEEKTEDDGKFDALFGSGAEEENKEKDQESQENVEKSEKDGDVDNDKEKTEEGEGASLEGKKDQEEKGEGDDKEVAEKEGLVEDKSKEEGESEAEALKEREVEKIGESEALEEGVEALVEKEVVEDEGKGQEEPEEGGLPKEVQEKDKDHEEAEELEDKEKHKEIEEIEQPKDVREEQAAEPIQDMPQVATESVESLVPPPGPEAVSEEHHEVEKPIEDEVASAPEPVAAALEPEAEPAVAKVAEEELVQEEQALVQIPTAVEEKQQVPAAEEGFEGLGDAVEAMDTSEPEINLVGGQADMFASGLTLGDCLDDPSAYPKPLDPQSSEDNVPMMQNGAQDHGQIQAQVQDIADAPVPMDVPVGFPEPMDEDVVPGIDPGFTLDQFS